MALVRTNKTNVSYNSYMLKFIKSKTTARGQKALVAALTRALTEHRRVLWIVTGGSNIPVSVAVMKQLPEALTPRLAVMLSDERFGPVGFPDSNLFQLAEAGFEPKRATVVPVLRPGVDFDKTVELYGQAAQTAIEAADCVIAQLGMGPDGHIAGILPGSVATKASKDWTVGFEWSDYTRISLTPFALAKVNQAFLLAFGESRRPMLEDLRSKNLSVAKQPAQLLKKLPEVYVYNDQIGDKS